MMFFGPPEGSQLSTHQIQNMRWRIRTKTNEELRQRFLTKYVPRIRSLGLTIPDDTLNYDEAKGLWQYQQPDWNLFRRIVNNDGPKSRDRLELRQMTYEEGRWVREVLSKNARRPA
jgi:ring-1,2-phenylacetyl-CoA epoxidase subunit PaaA